MTITTPYCGKLLINLEALKYNWSFLQDKVSKSGTKCASVVKADAYGIGIEKAVPALMAAGCETFFVATPQEGQRVRALSNNIEVYILSGFIDRNANFYHHYNLMPVLNSLQDIESWKTYGKGKPSALHIDTGMNRLGLRKEEAIIFLKKEEEIEKLNLNLLMTHLACGDMPQAPMNADQLSTMQEISALIPDMPVSLCNSAGIFNDSSFHFNLARPGIALYGGAALNCHIDQNPMKPVVKAEAKILQLREVKANESVGYSASEIVPKDKLIATLGVGYADGYIRKAGSTKDLKGASGYINGYYVPLVGRVSMDMIAVDVSNIPTINQGDYIELFGSNISISEVANHAGTIDYELLTGLGRRYERLYENF